MFDFLIGSGYDAAKAERVRELIAKHEVGGDEEQNLLMDADSISWLEVSAPRHIGKNYFQRRNWKERLLSCSSGSQLRKQKRLPGLFMKTR